MDQALIEGNDDSYLEAEFLSGEGSESAVVWRDGAVTLGPILGTGAINEALRTLGVSAPAGQEEFEVVGLGKHRSPHEWLQGSLKRTQRR